MICDGSNNDPYIQIYENALSSDICKEIINMFEENSEKQVNGATGIGIRPDIKVTKEMYFNVEPLKKYDNLLYENLKFYLNKYLENHLKNANKVEYSNIDDSGYQLQKYIANEGFYITHEDSNTKIQNNIAYSRIITYLWYLNDVEEGGETLFMNFQIKPKTGSLLLFPATWNYLHGGSMPISNDKYIITGWIWEKSI
jgi:hypothetical protein